MKKCSLPGHFFEKILASNCFFGALKSAVFSYIGWKNTRGAVNCNVQHGDVLMMRQCGQCIRCPQKNLPSKVFKLWERKILVIKILEIKQIFELFLTKFDCNWTFWQLEFFECFSFRTHSFVLLAFFVYKSFGVDRLTSEYQTLSKLLVSFLLFRTIIWQTAGVVFSKVSISYAISDQDLNINGTSDLFWVLNLIWKVRMRCEVPFHFYVTVLFFVVVGLFWSVKMLKFFSFRDFGMMVFQTHGCTIK